ncbi:MAG: DUF2070 family protein [Candidatus Micrarchaeia archaeon]
MEIQSKNFLPQKTYNFSFSLLLGLLLSIVFGFFCIFLSLKEGFITKLLYSFIFGIIVFFVPFFSSIIIVKIIRKKSLLKHLSFISFVALCLYGITLVISFFLKNIIRDSLIIGLSIGNSLVLISWFIGLKILMRSRKSLFLSLVHPSLNIIAFSILGKYLESITLFLILKLYLSIAVFFFMSQVLVYLLNAPMKRNFGISSMDLVVSFFGDRVTKEDVFGRIIEKIGERVTTYVDLIIFRTRNGIKTTFVIPGVHFGPFGSAGGSIYPQLLGKNNRVVFHSLTTHDFNPVYKKDYKIIEKIVEEEEKKAKKMKFINSKGNFFEIGARERILAIKVEKNYFFTLTRAPLVTEDIEEGVEVSLKGEAKLLGAENAFFVDAHNSRELGESATEVHIGSEIAEGYKKMLKEAMKIKPKEEKVMLGFASSQTKEAKDLGKGGIKVAVLKFKDNAIALVVIDGNNMLPYLRSELINEIREKFKIEAEIYTTDTHEVQKSGEKEVYVGEYTPASYLKKKVIECVEEALKNIEEVMVVFSERKINILLWGKGRENEIVATINSILAIFRIIAPAFVFIAMLVVAVLIWAI